MIKTTETCSTLSLDTPTSALRLKTLLKAIDFTFQQVHYSQLLSEELARAYQPKTGKALLKAECQCRLTKKEGNYQILSNSRRAEKDRRHKGRDSCSSFIVVPSANEITSDSSASVEVGDFTNTDNNGKPKDRDSESLT